MKTKNNKGFINIFISIFLYSLALLFGKIASNQKESLIFLVFYSISLMLLGIYAIVWQIGLKRTSLYVAYSMKSISFFFNMIFAFVFLKEAITYKMIIGTFFIILGICAIGGADE